MISIWRILRYGVQGFRRNIWLSAIAIITMVLTIVTITIFALGNIVATKKYQEFNTKIDYNIFINDSASEADVKVLRQGVTDRPEVATSTYFDKESVRKRFDQIFSSEDALKGLFTPDNNPLPREIDVKFKSPSQIDTFDQFVRQKRFEQVIEDTSYRNNKDLITNYIKLTNFLRVFGISFTLFFVFIAILVILNTIRLAIYSRREEVEVMRLVGATRSYIRGPFLIEGILFGAIGSLVAAVLTWVFLRQLQVVLASSLSDNTTNFISDLFSGSFENITTISGFNNLFVQLFVLQLAVGLMLGVMCSYLAVRRYLKE
jgi:cell division transport system permease protein